MVTGSRNFEKIFIFSHTPMDVSQNSLSIGTSVKMTFFFATLIKLASDNLAATARNWYANEATANRGNESICQTAIDSDFQSWKIGIYSNNICWLIDYRCCGGSMGRRYSQIQLPRLSFSDAGRRVVPQRTSAGRPSPQTCTLLQKEVRKMNEKWTKNERKMNEKWTKSLHHRLAIKSDPSRWSSHLVIFIFNKKNSQFMLLLLLFCCCSVVVVVVQFIHPRQIITTTTKTKKILKIINIILWLSLLIIFL